MVIIYKDNHIDNIVLKNRAPFTIGTKLYKGFINQLLLHKTSTKVHLVKAMVFPVVRYGCESWTVKKAKHRKIDAFELWCWRRLLRVPWMAKETQPVHPEEDQSWVFIGRTDAEAETPILWPPHVKS